MPLNVIIIAMLLPHGIGEHNCCADVPFCIVNNYVITFVLQIYATYGTNYERQLKLLKLYWKQTMCVDGCPCLCVRRRL